MKKADPRLLLIMSMTVFGTLGLFVRNIPVSSGELALYRAVLAALLIGVYLLVSRQKIPFARIKKEVPLLLLSGAAMGVNWILLFEAYRYTSVSVATLSYYFAPVIVTLVCPILFHEKLTGKKFLCFVMSTLGLVLITGIGDTRGLDDLKGILFGLGAAVDVHEISVDSGLIDAVSLILGGSGGVLVGVVALLFLVTLFGNMISWSMGVNSTAALAADHNDMPRVFAKRWAKNNMPVGAAVTSGVVASCVCVLGVLIEMASPDSSLFWSFFALNLVMLLLSYLPVFPAFLKLRREDAKTPRPFRVPGADTALKWIAYVPMVLIVISIIFTAVPLSFDAETLASFLPITIGSILSVAIGEVLIALRGKNARS